MTINEFAETLNTKSSSTPLLKALQRLRRTDLGTIQASGATTFGWYPWIDGEAELSRA